MVWGALCGANGMPVFVYPLASDAFARPDGALGTAEAGGAWTGATWTVASGKAVNTPTLGGELLANGNMETGDPPSSWSTTGTWARDATAHGGSYAGKLTSASGAVNTYQSTVTVAGTWYQLSGWFRTLIGTCSVDLESVSPNVTLVTTPALTLAAYSLVALAVRATTTGTYVAWWARATNDSVLADDQTFKPLTLSTLFASLAGLPTTYSASVDVTLAANSTAPAGLGPSLDSAATPANFLLATHDRTTLVVAKCVAGTYTTLWSGTTAYVAGATLRVDKLSNGVALLYYNGTLVGAAIVGDTGIVSNTLGGMFSTYSGHTLDNFVVNAAPALTTLLSDTFTRDNGAIGTAETGGAWTVDAGGANVATNQMAPTANPTLVSLNAGNLSMTAKVAAMSTNYANASPGLSVRGIDTDNLLLAELFNGAVNFYKRVTGTYTLFATVAMTLTNSQTYTIMAACVGNLIVVSVDGVQRLSYTLTGDDITLFSGATATRAGMRVAGTLGTNARFDNFSVTTP